MSDLIDRHIRKGTIKDWHEKPPPKVRSVSDALTYAERRRTDLPHVVQVYASDWDTVILADRITELEAALEACRHEAESSRTWNGQGWTYNGYHIERVHAIADKALEGSKP